MIPLGLSFGLGLLSADGWGQIFPKWPSPEKCTLMNIPESFASNALPPQQATFTPVFPGCPPRTAVRFDPDSYGDCFALGPSACESLCAPSKNGVSASPVLWSSCAQAPLAFNARCSVGSFSQCQIPRHRDFTRGSELLFL